MAKRVAVVGGGISGLASALRVADLGHSVTLFEGDSVLGGLGTTFPYGDGHLERFYHCILPGDAALLGMIRRVGLERELLWRRTTMGFMHGRRLFPMNTPLDLLRFAPLPLVDRLRMGLMGLRARADGANPALDDIEVERWLKRQVGERAFDVVWRPLLEAKIGERYSGIPALWLTRRMAREKSTHQEIRGCLARGHRSLVDALERSLLDHGASIRLRTRIEAIGREGEAMAVHPADGTTEIFDAVVATTPLLRFQEMTRGLRLDPAVADLALDYQGVVSGVFLLERPLSRNYWMPVVESGATCQGVVEMSNLMPLARSQGRYLTYLVNYAHRESALYQKSDAEMLALYRRDLAELFPAAGRSVVDQFLFRAPFVEPIWRLGYRRQCPPTSLIPGRLYLACTAQVYPNVNSWNSCCEVVERLIPALATELAATTTAQAR